MKRILGLDLGTNSIGWAVVNADCDGNEDMSIIGVEAAGSRIIPMDAAILGDFDRGNTISQTAERTKFRGNRRLRERCILRRDRLNRTLNILGFLPTHYAQTLDRYGKIKEGEEPKLAWMKNTNGNYEFLFVTSFNEMLAEFRIQHPEFIDKNIPYDWTIYYLRKKALTQKIEKAELAWILLNFNQKRGYYQLRGEEEEKESSKRVEYIAQEVVAVEDTGEKKDQDTWYNVQLKNGWIYRRTSRIPLDWVGKIKEFIVTTELDRDGNPKLDKEGNIKRSFRSPKEDDWTLIKERTQSEIERSGKTVGAYIYDTILSNPSHKIRGRLIRTIERKFFKEELRYILNKQIEFHPELQDNELYKACIKELYSSNDAYRASIANRGFKYLFVDDIIFYQRPLKSKKSLIANCPYEGHIVKNENTGDEKHYGVKCIAKSHPLYQEFRLWQFLSNLRIYKKGLAEDIDVTSEFLKTEDDYVSLFDWLNERKSIDQKAFVKYPPFGLKKSVEHYRWNYVEDKQYPCNETNYQILAYLNKANVSSDFFNAEKGEQLWHILYSIEDKIELIKALQKFAAKNQLSDLFVDVFQKFPPFKKEYGAFSAKAIRKLLSLMRAGKYWSENAIDENTLVRIKSIINGEYDEKISDRIREKLINFNDISSFRGLPVWLACYIVYNRHSEAKEIMKWEKPTDLQNYLKSFKQHSLRNPIVEQIVTETLRTVSDIWEQYGNIDEIHVELGREMKNPADKRRKMSQQISENENANLRIKAMLMEFVNPEFEIDNVRPSSPNQQDILRIYEEGVLSSVEDIPVDIASILKKFKESDINKYPSRKEVLRYRLWLEQKYRSPYTGQPISLSKLFTSAYEIEHIVPQSRYFDDSLSNKVICESEVNKLKSNLLGYEFIKKHAGEIVDLNYGKNVKIFTEDEYVQFVKEHYGNNKTKLRKLMMDEIPDKFISRQLNDSRYISKVVIGLLSNIVREDGEEDAISKNVIVCTGGITDRLKKDWGLNDVWNKIILPRFKRMNELTATTRFTSRNTIGHEIPSMPLEHQKGFSKKRIDHRHHAMDAIVIACAGRNIVNYLNNESARSSSKISRYDLQCLLCNKVRTDETGGYKWVIKKPWETFTQDVWDVINGIIVSFKQNLRVINKATNRNVRFKNGEKVHIKQEGLNWAIRKPMHKDTVYGEVNLRKIKQVSLNEALKDTSRVVHKEFKHLLISLLKKGYDAKRIKKYIDDNSDVWQDINLKKIDVYYFTKETKDRFFATRFLSDLVSYFSGITKESEAIKKIDAITDTGIQKILWAHLKSKNNNPELAFSADGIDEMNKNIVQLNNGKEHKPIYKIRRYEKADKFTIGIRGNKHLKFVEAAKGTNLYFAIYENERWDDKLGEFLKKRTYATIPLNVVIERLKQNLPPVPDDENGNKPKFVLSPNNLVYVPSKEEIIKGVHINSLDVRRIYRFVDSSNITANFIPCSVANLIYSLPKDSAARFCNSEVIIQNEYGIGSPQSKNQKAVTGEMIKEVCIPIKVDRLGNIIKVGY